MRIWEFDDSKSIPTDLVREQDFILRLRRLQRLGMPHLVIHIALSMIEAIGKSRQTLENAQKELQTFAGVTHGTYAEMSNGDVFIVWEETGDADLLAQRLMAALTPHAAAPARDGLLVYRLPQDYAALRQRANDYVELVHNAGKTDDPTPSEALQSEAARGPLTAWSVDQIGKLLGDIDLRSYARAQGIYRIDAAGHKQKIAGEYHISFDELRRERFPKLNLITPEHLFLALCEILDHNFLALLTEQPDLLPATPTHLNLSVATVMGPVFAHFMRGLPAARRAALCFEIHRGDWLQDFALTLNAFSVLKQEGFKIALDAVTADMAAYVKLAAFEADYIKINVSKDRVAALTEPAAREALAQLPADKLIFYRCDNETARVAGKALGVTLYQGWLMDEKAA